MARIARIDAAAAATLAEWLERVKLYDQARVAYEQLRSTDPRRDEYLEALIRVNQRAGGSGHALFWARRWVQQSGSADAYARLASLLQQGDATREAQEVTDAGLSRYPKSAPLVALKVKTLLADNQLSDARQLLVEQTVGQRLDINDEIVLLKLRIQVETRAGNKRRAARFKSRLGELENMVKSGYRGLSPRSRL